MSQHIRFLTIFFIAVLFLTACDGASNSVEQVPNTGLLLVEEYPLKSLECESDPEARCFVPVSGTFDEIIAKRQAERDMLADPLDLMNSPNQISSTLDGKPLIASLSNVTEGDSSTVTAQVKHADEVIFELPLGQAAPLHQLQGIWVSAGHWYLEVAQYIPGSEYPYAKGFIVQDGESLNEIKDYQDAFGFAQISGKSFFFVQQSGLIDAFFDGEAIPLGYEEIAHYGCCSAARLNPIKAKNMISFFGKRDGTWHYVEAGIYT